MMTACPSFKMCLTNMKNISGGSVRDVLCGPKYPLPPRPLPHGGVYGNMKCPACRDADHLLKTVYGMLHKKMKKLINNQFDKAKIILQVSDDYLKEIRDCFQC